MADFEFELEITARLEELEAALDQAVADTEKAAKRMANASKNEAGGGFSKLAGMAVKVAAAVAGVETALGLANVAMNAMTGNTEGLVESLAGLPIIGGIANRAIKLAQGLEKASDASREFRQQAFQLTDAVKSLNGALAYGQESLNLFIEEQQRIGGDEIAVIEATAKRRIELIDLQHEMAMNALEQEQKARIEALYEKDLGLERQSEEERRILGEIEKRRQIEIQTLETRKRLAALRDRDQKREIEATREAERQAKIAERQAEIDAAAEAHQAAIVEMMEEEARKREEIAKKEEEARKAAEAFEAARVKAEEERAKAEQEAKTAVAGAVKTFGTAGGSFTTGVAAQVNEAKVLNKISEQSRDFLMQIVANTARMAGGLNLA